MQLVLPWLRSIGRTRPASSSKHPEQIEVNGRTYQLTVARHRRARRYVLRMTPEGALRLTVPSFASIARGIAFVRSQAAWIAREQARRDARAHALTEGGLVWFRGERVAFVRGFQERMQATAKAELPARCLELAEQHGITVSRITVRNQRSRWGSCSRRASIALNWRLIQMPPFVSDYVILHELMHTRQPNHSRAFWRQVASVCPAWREAEAWLKRHGRELL